MTLNKPIKKQENAVAVAVVMAFLVLKICTVVAFVCMYTKPHECTMILYSRHSR